MTKSRKKNAVAARRRPSGVSGTAARRKSPRQPKQAGANGLLRQANARVELILESITDRFFGLDREWRFTYLNKHAREMLKSLGRNPAALIGKVYWDEFPVRYAEDAVRRAMSERVEVAHEFYFPPLKQWIEGRIYPTPDGGLAIYQRDITERKRAEEGLRRSEAYLAEGERIAHMGSWAVKIPSGEIFWSREMYRIYQLDPTRTSLSIPAVFELIHPDDREGVREAFEHAIRDKSNYEVHHRAILPDGTLKYFHSLGRPVLNDSGEVVEYLGMVIDVTKQTQVEALLREANEKVEMILDSMTDMFFAVDKEWRYTYFNPRAKKQLRFLGKDPEALIGKTLWSEFPDNPVTEYLHRAMRERLALAHEHFYPPLGEWVENRMFPMPDGGLVMYVRYVTERKRAEEALHKSQTELAKITRITTMGEMAASIAHEINQPLGAIVNNGNVCLQLVGKPGGEKRAREALLDIVSDANRASAIITRIRALTKRTAARKTSLSVKELVADVLALAHPGTIKARVTTKTSVPASLRVPGDRVQLQQMLLNLALNGIEAMSAGGNRKRVLTISAKLNQLEGKPAVFLTVHDTGSGFEPKESDRLFDAFYTTKPNGMGMGLRISRSAAEAHGGKLWAGPPNGRGATFHCALPAEVESKS